MSKCDGQTLEAMHDDMWDQGLGQFTGAPPLGAVIAMMVTTGYLKECRDHKGHYLRDPNAPSELLTQAIELASGIDHALRSP